MRRERVIKSRDESVVMVRPFTMVPNVIELSYYSNVLLSHFVLDSVVGECQSQSCHNVTSSDIIGVITSRKIS